MKIRHILFVLLLLFTSCTTTPEPKSAATSFPDPAIVGARDEFARPPYPVATP